MPPTTEAFFMKLYHYTNGNKIHRILQEGLINTSPDKPKPREKGIVWLSSHPEWEKTANKIILKDGETTLLNQKETEYYCKGLFRLVLDTETYPSKVEQWPKIAVLARMPQNIKKRLVSRAKKASVNPSQWFGTLHPIETKYLTVEVYINNKWIGVNKDEIKLSEHGLNIVDAGTSIKVSADNSQWKNI